MLEKIFSLASFFLLRIPTWPVSKFKPLPLDKKCDSSVEIYFRNKQLREAIAIASPSLYDSLRKRVPKNLNQASKSLSHYISRMMVRSTPFGLFSSVVTAEWGETTTIYFDEQLLRKRTRLDMEWVYLLIQKLYQEERIFPSLHIRTNPLLHLNGERYHLNYSRFANDAENKALSSISHSVSIPATSLIQLILEFSKEGVPVDHLWLKIQESLPILEQEKTFEVVHKLFSQQFLIPQLLPSLLSSSPLDNLIPCLSLFPGFEAILEEIKNYNELSPGTGEEALEKLQDKMGTLVSNKSYLQVDVAYEEKNLKLSKNVSEEVEKAVNLLWKIACIKKTPANLTNYHSKFLEKYGEYRIVSLLELLDEERGLGPLFENSNSPLSNQDWEKWLSQQWQECLFHKKKEWMLTEENIDSFFMKQNRTDPVEEAPLSLDLLCKVFADSHQNIDLGKFSLLLCDIYQEGASSFGRFLDLLGNDTQVKVAQFFALEEQLDVQSRFIELSYFPAVLRGANVTIHPCLRRHRLDIQGCCDGHEGAFSLEDIYVGATSSKFYLTNEKCQFNIITRENHLFNVDFAPLPIKFMRYVTRSQYTQLSLFSWGSIQEMAVFLPRVRFGKTILSPAKWNIDPKPYFKGTDAKNIASFNAWAAQWDLPQNFFLVQGDQQLLLERDNPNHLEEILSRLKRGEVLKFVEKIEGAWIRGTEGNHYSELCIPFIKNREYTKKENPIKAASYSSSTNEIREKFPGSDWLHLKLYMEEDRINEFLVRYLYNFIESLSQEGTIKEWFIVRYRDPESHLRLRVHSQSFEISKILSAFEQQFRLWSHLGWMKDVSIAKYEREIERYGGAFLIEAAETVFYHDTIATLHIIHAFITKQAQCEEMVLHALSIVNFLSNFGLNINQMISFLHKLTLNENELKGFRQHKNQLITLINILQQESNSEILEIQVMNIASQIRSEGIQNFCQLAADLEKDRWDSIVNSLLHMHCNRLGCLGTREIQAKIYTRQALLSILNSGKSADLDFPINQVVRK